MNCGLHPPGDLRFRQPEHILIVAGVHRTVLILQLHLNLGPLKVPLVTDSQALAWCRQLHHGYRIGRSALS